MSTDSVESLVIGSGLSGLAAGWALAKQRRDFRVIGQDIGTAWSFSPSPGWLVERGPHSFTSRAEPVFTLARSLGLTPTRAQSGARYLAWEGKLKKAGLGLVPRIFGELLHGFFGRAPGVTESLGSWVEERFGPVLAHGPVRALIKGIWATSPDRIELASGFPALYQALLKSRSLLGIRLPPAREPAGIWSLPGGMGSLSKAMVEQLGKHYQQAKTLELSRDNTGFLVRTTEGMIACQRLILATPAPQAANLLLPVLPTAAGTLGQLQYAPVRVIHWLAADCAYPAGFGWLSVDDGPILGTLCVSDVFPERAPAGLRSFATMLGGTFSPMSLETPEVEVVKLLQEKHEHLTGKSLKIEQLHSISHLHAVAIPEPGHKKRLLQLKAMLPSEIRLAGAYMGSGAMPDAIAAGMAAVEAGDG